MGKYYIEKDILDKAKENYEQAMQDVKKAIETDSKDLKDKIAYMRHLGDTYRALIRANL